MTDEEHYELGGELQEKRRSPRRLLKGFAFIIISSALLAVLVYSPLFAVRHIEVIGNRYMPEKDVIRISGAYMGAPLFALETNAMTQNLKKDLRIEQAVVRRSLPSTLEIEIKERRPIATLAADFGYVDLDREGTVIDAYKTLKTMQIPMITGKEVRDLYIGDKTEDSDTQKAIRYLMELQESTQSLMSEVSLADVENVTAFTTTGATIYLGSIDTLDEKVAMTDQFAKDMASSSRPIAYVDFKYAAPFIKFKEPLIK
ncbi:hypothetical protein TAMA11512_04780 [Selenomonas sp. TAMA-11512]|uniref:cell division protein FtsQ/DivIB n=1 Tax=Selenomonas sp. TAMA-11512 TaxID=3095337 RepID=UPI00308AF63C|nr:hypothetical protein TAMA11512_04780 [Selenomonas sp. TAMA-11512]